MIVHWGEYFGGNNKNITIIEIYVQKNKIPYLKKEKKMKKVQNAFRMKMPF